MKFKYNCAIAAIIKNEADYIGEWVLYHKLIGIDHIYIFENGSEDRTKEILNKYVHNGYITIIDFPGPRQQIPAYNYAIKHFKRECKYIAFIDADEFIYVHDGNLLNCIKTILAKDKRAGGIAVNWRMFGSSGHETKPKGLVIENYLYRAKNGSPGTSCVKSIVNPRKVISIHHPHYPIYFPLWYNIDENGNKVKHWKNEVADTNLIQINHYFTKSKEEWIKRRSNPRIDNGELRAMDEFYEHDNNDIYDEGMLKYASIINSLQANK